VVPARAGAAASEAMTSRAPKVAFFISCPFDSAFFSRLSQPSFLGLLGPFFGFVGPTSGELSSSPFSTAIPSSAPPKNCSKAGMARAAPMAGAD
jgi:hypothetical protein